MFSASLLGLFPDERAERLRSRSRLIESVAVHFCGVARKVDATAVGKILADLIARNPDLISIGIRRPDGQYLVEAGEHRELWDASGKEDLIDTQMQFPLYGNSELWGTLEARFVPTMPLSRFRWWPGRRTQSVVFVGFLCLVLFHLFLRKALQHLNPSRAVPRRVHEALDALAEGLVILDEAGRIVLTNSAFATAVSIPREKIVGMLVSEFTWQHKAGALLPWQQVLQGGETLTGVLMRSAETGDRTFSVSAVPIRDDLEVVRGAMVSFEDVTALEKNKAELVRMLDELRVSRDEIRDQNEELEKLATQDPLTGCLNRRAFFGRFELHWKLAEKHQQALSCVIVDVDHFKSVNDTWGHSTGDEVLSAVGRLLGSLVQNQECVCRYGGEEFCILLPETSLDTAAERAELIRTEIAGLQFSQLSITASLGVSSRDQNAAGPLLMLEQADKCLYAAKRSGRNRVVRFDSMPVLPDEGKGLAQSRREKREEQGPVPFEAVSALLAALSFRDPATAEHSRRVADLCVQTGASLLSKADCYTLEMAALLHDIGKVGVPDSILLKSGELSHDEWTVMDRHELFGVEIVRKAFASSQLAAIIQYHRAWFNGLARNESLPAGASIPIEARLLAIADAYDSMTMNRSWRKGRTRIEAFEELRRCAGTQFDPELVEHFIAGFEPEAASDRDAAVSRASTLLVLNDLNAMASSLTERDFDRVVTISTHIEQTAAQMGATRLRTKAEHLRTAVLSESEILEILQMAQELTQECRQLNRLAKS
jgi:diguanylate cyclase (GGDEF)-like protein/PAS domain S-box-containing protein